MHIKKKKPLVIFRMLCETMCIHEIVSVKPVGIFCIRCKTVWMH